MSDYSTVTNVTAGPLVIDAAGHVLGAGATGPAKVDRGRGRELVLEGRLRELELPDGFDVEQLRPEIREALERTAALNAAVPTKELEAMKATELVAHLREVPGDAERVYALEAARTEQRSTVLEAVAAAGYEAPPAPAPDAGPAGATPTP